MAVIYRCPHGRVVAGLCKECKELGAGPFRVVDISGEYAICNYAKPGGGKAFQIQCEKQISAGDIKIGDVITLDYIPLTEASHGTL